MRKHFSLVRTEVRITVELESGKENLTDGRAGVY